MPVIPMTAPPPVLTIADDFKRAMRNTASSVNVPSCGGADGGYGMTATAFSSISADPPTVMVAVNRSAGLYHHLLVQRNFCVNLLEDGQQDLANDFAGRLPASERFARHRWYRLHSGNPALIASCAGFDCSIIKHFHVGSHLVAIATIQACWENGQSPLQYSTGRYGRFL